MLVGEVEFAKKAICIVFLFIVYYANDKIGSIWSAELIDRDISEQSPFKINSFMISATFKIVAILENKTIDIGNLL